MSREVLNREKVAEKMFRPDVLRIQPRGGNLFGELRDGLADLAEVPGGEVLGEPIDLLGRVAQGLSRLARGRAVAVCDDVGRHARAVGSVLLVDVLDDALALIAGGKVEVDVGPLASLFREEAL